MEILFPTERVNIPVITFIQVMKNSSQLQHNLVNISPSFNFTPQRVRWVVFLDLSWFQASNFGDWTHLFGKSNGTVSDSLPGITWVLSKS